MHDTIAGAIFHLGAKRRNPSLEAEYRRVKESEGLDRKSLDELQFQRAVAFLDFAGEHSPYYRKLFRERGFHPRRIDSLEDLAILPAITKDELMAATKEIHTDFPFRGTFNAETSGTTGGALEFRKDERWDSINRAYLMRGYDWYGVKPWSRNGYLWGYDIAPAQRRKTRMLDALQNRFRIFTYDRESVREFAAKLESAAYVAGYSSMIYEVAKLINESGLRCPQLKMVKGTSEMILDSYQPEAEKAFGRRIVSEYGAAEAGLIAFECPQGSMHINVEDVVVETDPDGGIIVTNVASRSFPIVRYRLGDAIRLSDEPCSCGRAHPVIAEILGRKGATVEGREKRYPALTFYYVFKNLALQESVLLNYKALQEEPGSIVVNIEGPENRIHEPMVRAELRKYFADDLSIDLRFVDSFDRATRKMQYFESRL